jgi:hypothetical protein
VARLSRAIMDRTSAAFRESSVMCATRSALLVPFQRFRPRAAAFSSLLICS